MTTLEQSYLNRQIPPLQSSVSTLERQISVVEEVLTDGSLAQETTLQTIEAKLPEIGPALPEDSMPVILPRTLVDAFGRIRTSEIFTIFDSKLIQDKLDLYWDETITGTATSVYDQTNARVRVTVNDANEDVIRQTFQRFNYQPGKSQLIFLTTCIKVAGTYDDGVQSEVGYYDENNGVFWGYNNTDELFISIRKNASDSKVAQSSWNLDTMDGSGPFGIALDPTKTQIFVINFEWLGVGSVWFGVVVDGGVIWVHRNDNANVEPTVYMSTPNCPIRYSISSTGAGAGATGAMDHICSSVNSEGGVEPTGIVRSLLRYTTAEIIQANTANIEYVGMLMRYKSGSEQVTIDFTDAAVLGTTNDPFVWLIRLFKDDTKINNFDTNAFTGLGDSCLEYWKPGNTVTVIPDGGTGTSGIVLASGFAERRTTIPDIAIKNSLRLGATIGGVSDIIGISVMPLTAGLDAYCSMTWREFT